jgi:hypothetical protein
MSHDGIWRAACKTTIHIPWFHFEVLSVARGVTDVGVGSGALLGRFSACVLEEESVHLGWRRQVPI